MLLPWNLFEAGAFARDGFGGIHLGPAVFHHTKCPAAPTRTLPGKRAAACATTAHGILQAMSFPAVWHQFAALAFGLPHGWARKRLHSIACDVVAH